MSNLHLVTGYAGQAHVTAADDGSFNTAIFGNGQYVLDIGNKFAASVVSNNKITIADGDLLMQGRHVRLNEGTTVDLTITNGTQGKLRNDLIVARYTKDSVSGVEQVNLVVIKGTAVDSNPADPAYTNGDIINDHALLNDMPLYRVPLNGLTVGTPVALFSVAAVQIPDGAVTGDMLSDDVTALSLGGISITKLWENASPTSTFAAQTIALDLSVYDAVEIYYYGQLDHLGYGYRSARFSMGIQGAITHAEPIGNLAYILSATRRVKATTTGVVFGTGYSTYVGASSTTPTNPDNADCVPYQIYGIKGVK